MATHTLSCELRNEAVLAWLLQSVGSHQISFAPISQPTSLAQELPALGQQGKRRTAESSRGSDNGGNGKRPRAFALREIGSARISKGVVTEMRQPVQPMLDSSRMFQSRDAEGLWLRYARDGYLYVPRVLDAAVVHEAHNEVMHGLRRLQVLAPDGKSAAVGSGWTVELASGVVISGTDVYSSETTDVTSKSIWKSVGDGPAIQAVPQSTSIQDLLTLLAEGRSLAEKHKCEARVFQNDFKWLRVKAKGEMTVEHADEFYYHLHTNMFQPPEEPIESIVCEACASGDQEEDILLCDECGDGYHMGCLEVPLHQFPEGEWFCKSCTPRPTLGTVWIPLEDVPAEHGVLAMLPGSQYLSNFTKNYRESQLPASYFKEARGMTWHTTDYAAGDLVIFDSRIVHATSKNYLQSFRLSLDFRWYIAPGRDNFGATPHSQFVLRSTEPVDGGQPSEA